MKKKFGTQLLTLFLFVLPAYGEAQSLDAFDPRSCQGQDLYFRNAGPLFQRGANARTMDYIFAQRERGCSKVSGCSDWVTAPLQTVRAGLLLRAINDSLSVGLGYGYTEMFCTNPPQGGDTPIKCYQYRSGDETLFTAYHTKMTDHCFQTLGYAYNSSAPELPQREFAILAIF